MATITKLHRETGIVYKARVRCNGQPELSHSFKTRSGAVKWAKAREVEPGDPGRCPDRSRQALALGDSLAHDPEITKPIERNGGTRFLSEDELGRLLAACRESSSPDLLLAVLLSITTGARQGELLGLRWKDLDLAAGTLQLRVDNETSTKGGIRSLPIAAQVLSLLQARRDEIRKAKVTALRDEGLVFPSRVTGSKPISLRTPWETALKRVGIEGFKWHELRHSAASFRAKGGASLLEIGAVLGHKSANTTKRYVHLTEQHTNALVLDMADKLLGGL